jgi:hypothetical protein
VSAMMKQTQVRLTRSSPAYCRVTFDNPPLNPVRPEHTLEMSVGGGAQSDFPGRFVMARRAAASPQLVRRGTPKSIRRASHLIGLAQAGENPTRHSSAA